nr:alpha/beta hydrolases superfamily protein [Tanacetum cinerariifolium]
MFYIIYFERAIRNRTFAHDVTAKITTKNDVTFIVCLCQTSLAFDAIGWDVRMGDTFPTACNFSVESCSRLGKAMRCGDPNHLIGECPKPLKDKNQIDFVRGSWSDSGEEGDEKVKDEMCLVAHESRE